MQNGFVESFNDHRPRPNKSDTSNSQFRAANALGRPRVGAVNTVMIDWLERCKDHGWELVTDKIPLLDAVENKLRSQPGTKLDT